MQIRTEASGGAREQGLKLTLTMGIGCDDGFGVT